MRIRKTGTRAAALLAASALLLAAAGGCATSLVQRKVTLRYEGPKPATLVDPSVQAFPEIAVAPFVDLRRSKSSYGTYVWGNLSVDYISGEETVAGGITRLVREFLEKAGVRVVRGSWDGRLASLPRASAEHVLYGEIERLDFSGQGRFFESRRKGLVRIVVKWGNRRARKVVRRTVEITPDRRDFHLFAADYDHVSRMEAIIRRSVSNAVRESIGSLFRTK